MSKFNDPQEKNYYIQNRIKILLDILEIVKKMKVNIQENIDKFNNNLEQLEIIINNYIILLKVNYHGNQDSNNNIVQNDFNEDIRKKIKLIIDSRIKIYNLFDEFINFDFSPIESDFMIDFKISTNDISFQSYDSQNSIQNENFSYLNEVEIVDENTSRHDTNDKCIKCNLKKSSCIYLNNEYCKDCINKLKNELINEGKNLDDIIYFENKKTLFMKSLETLIKTILLKFNFILNNGSRMSINMENHIGRNIYQKINYPILMSKEYKVLDEDFMKKINIVLKNDFNADFKNFSVKDFKLFNLNELIKETLEKIFKDKTILDADKINIIEDDDNSEMIEIDNLDVNNE